MSVKEMEYKEARKYMKLGDVIAFGGRGGFSSLVKFATRSSVSHVGVVLQTKIPEDKSGRFFNQIIESTSLNGFNGVVTSRLSDRIGLYDGDIWWLPMDTSIRHNYFNQKKFFNFLFNQAKAKKHYDISQAVRSAIDFLPFSESAEDFSKFFCSELVVAGLEIAGAIGSVNASEVTPIELCRWRIYGDNYFQLKGEPKEISQFNSVAPPEFDLRSKINHSIKQCEEDENYNRETIRNVDIEKVEHANKDSDVIHGRTCYKVKHVGDGYLHCIEDDTPYQVDEDMYCGRCHVVLSMEDQERKTNHMDTIVKNGEEAKIKLDDFASEVNSQAEDFYKILNEVEMEDWDRKND